MPESDHDKLIRMEEREKMIQDFIKEVKEELKWQREFLENGLSKKIALQIKNGNAKTILGVKPEHRDFVNKWLIRLAVYLIGGKELFDAVMR